MSEKEILLNNLDVLKNQLMNQLDNISKDYVRYKNIDNINFIDDSLNYYANEYISVYASTNLEYYHKNEEKCKNALLELYGDERLCDLLSDKTIDDLLVASSIEAQLYENIDLLNDDKLTILDILSIKYIIYNIEDYFVYFENMDFDSIMDKLFNDIEISNCNKGCDLIDIINDFFKYL